MSDLSRKFISGIDNDKCLFYVSRRRKWQKDGEQSGPWDLSTALHIATSNFDAYKVIVILRDAQGQDHPDNKGKAFLYQILK